MVYIKLEENLQKYIDVKYEKIPDFLRKIVYKLKYRSNTIINKKVNNGELIVLPSVNKRVINNLKRMKNIRCWKNICISNNLKDKKEFIDYTNENNLNIIDGKWLLKNIVDKIIEYIAECRKEDINTYEVTVLCNKLDNTIVEKIREICPKVKKCNIITNNQKQFKKLENELYKDNGLVLNVSTNYKKMAENSIIVINFDFTEIQIKKCIFKPDTYIINTNKDIEKTSFDGKNLISYKIDLPEKYLELKGIFDNFDDNSLYESFIYKNTSYKNIKKEIIEDKAKIACLKDFNNKILKKSEDNLSKMLDKITN